jgi:putative peptidoglycan lipid II flippase
VKVAAVTLVVNLIFSLFLMGPLKHGGLALSLSIASTFQFSLLVIFLKRKIDLLDLKPLLTSLGKTLSASMIMGIVLYYLHTRWGTPQAGSDIFVLVTHLAGLVLTGILIYFVTARLLGSRELKAFYHMLSRR